MIHLTGLNWLSSNSDNVHWPRVEGRGHLCLFVSLHTKIRCFIFTPCVDTSPSNFPRGFNRRIFCRNPSPSLQAELRCSPRSVKTGRVEQFMFPNAFANPR